MKIHFGHFFRAYPKYVACGLSNDILDLVPDRLEPVLGGQKIGKKISYLLRAYLLRVERLLRDHLSVLHVSSYTPLKVAFFKLRQHRIVKPTQFWIISSREFFQNCTNVHMLENPSELKSVVSGKLRYPILQKAYW